METFRIKALGIETYRKPRTANKWLVPVCADLPAVRTKLSQLRPNHPGNWETADIDGCPTVCYRLTGAQIRTWNKLRLKSVWPQFSDRLGFGVTREFWPGLWTQFRNIEAKARNTWEEHHGGIKGDRFARGMSVRSAASLSIT